ncbi:MAG: double-strand break repair protein AddB [Pseudomonadota bacterium]
MLFSDASPAVPGTPRVFALPAGADYASAFAAGLRARLAATPPEAVLGVEVLVNTRRALRTLEDALAGGAMAFLPRLSLLEALPERAAQVSGWPSAPAPNAAVDPLTRQVALMRLVAAWIERSDGAMPPAAAPDLAETLGALIDELDEAGVDPGTLEGALAAATGGGPAAPEALAAHWQNALAFLDIARREWPALRAIIAPGAVDGAARQRAAIARLLAAWQAAPPEGPLIVAGSTGSRPGTAALMAAIARLPQGAVVLPGFDPSVAPDIWERAGPDHPMGPFKPLFEQLGLEPADVAPWLPMEERAAGPARRRLLGEALRPAPVTDAWAAERDTLAALAPTAAAGLTLLEAPHPRAEAEAIALAVREALEEPGRRVAIVTRDAALARRVTAALDRYGVLADDSLGRPLALSPAGIFLTLVRDAALTLGGAPNAVALAALLGHPFCRLGHARGVHRRLAARYERAVLRRRGGARTGGALLPPWPASAPEGEDQAALAERAAWLTALEAALGPLAEALRTPSPLATLLAAHRAAVAALTRAGEDPAAPAPEEPQPGARFGGGPDGLAVERLFDALENAAAAAGGTVAAAAYASLLAGRLGGETLRPEAGRPHPRVAIWGTMEARTASADLTILAGVNEGTWPALPDPGAWLNRPMRAALGLAQPERAIGLAAHDFLQAACRPEVLITRSLRMGGEPTVPSRWLIRLETLLAGTAPGTLEEMRGRGARILDLLPLLDHPAEPEDPALHPAGRPCPAPPPPARPRRLSASDIERLIRDPYAVYARRVLQLRPLDPLGAPADVRDRGTVLHAVMERFMAAAVPGPVDVAAEAARLRTTAEEVIADSVADPAQARFWRALIARLADGMAADEAERREGVAAFAVEVSGRFTLPIAGAPFLLTAKADRIDRRGDGRGSVYDYKSSPPGQGEIGVFEHQLHLQALMLAEGAFEGLPPLGPGPAAYIGLGGHQSRGPNPPLSTEALAAYRERLTHLLERYTAPETGFLSRRAMKREQDAGDYDHLARRREWEGRDG